MKRCLNCNGENAQVNTYCEHCGTPLAAFTVNSPSEQTYASVNEAYTTPSERSVPWQDYTPPPPPPPPLSQGIYPVPASAPSFPFPASSYSIPAPIPDDPRKRSFGAALLSSILYLLGAFCFVFGVAGFTLYGTSTTLVGLVFIGLSIVALIVLVPLLIARKQLVLKWWVRILTVLGLAIVATCALFVVAMVNSVGSHSSANYVAFGFVFVIYGFVTAVVAFW